MSGQIILSEHGIVSQEDKAKWTGILESIPFQGMPKDYMGAPTYLGLDTAMTANYFIGTCWLRCNELSLVVHPKIAGIDLAEMLVTALNVTDRQAVDYFYKCYGISFDEPAIETQECQSQLTPLLIVHYILLLESLVRHGLRKEYVTREETLKGKIKGHILFARQVRECVIPKQEHKNVCRYQIYTEDNPVNQLLKLALAFADKMLRTYLYSHPSYKVLRPRICRLDNAFARVSLPTSVPKVRRVSASKIFRHYTDAVRLARTILRRYDYSLSNISKDRHSTPPFWIDMSRLFEMYVLSKLRAAYGNNILFQVSGHSNEADYLHLTEETVIDAKYKPQYGTKDYLIEDIREISGYARDNKITAHFTMHNTPEPRCLIVYPSTNGITEFQGAIADNPHAQEISQFRGFRKLGIRLPVYAISQASE